MKSISNIAQGIAPSSTLAVDSLAKEMKKQGIDVITFGTGEPDFDTPENIKQAGIEAIRAGFTKYTAAAGMPELRSAVCQRLKADCGLDYENAEITIASGAKHSVYLALACTVNPGDEVILPAPYWVSYYEIIRMVGGVPVIVNAEEKNSFKISASQLEAAITDKTKILILNNPSNPTGMLYTRRDLEELADVCVKHDIYVLSDEIYYRLVYDGNEFVSFASLGPEVKERTILINGVSKSYAMTGWRVGYSAANKQISKVMANFVSHSTGAPATMAQMAAIEALLGDQSGIESMRGVFEQRRDYIVKRVNSIAGVSCLKPEGAFYVMMNIEKLKGRTLGGKLINNGDDFAMAFLEKGLVALVSCSGFGTPDFVRWSYAASMENIKKGLDRLEKFINS